MKLIHRNITRILFVMFFMLGLPAANAAPTWEKIGGVTVELAESSPADNFELNVVDNGIELTVYNKSDIKVFTILGQLVVQAKLDAGKWHLPLKSRGIYIFKVGTTTRRVTI